MTTKPTLKELYVKYEKAVGSFKVCYGTLYAKAGGKKDVKHFNKEYLNWYIGAVERLHRAMPKYNTLLKEHESKLIGLKTCGADVLQLIEEENRSFETSVTEFWEKRFISTLDILCYHTGLKLYYKKLGNQFKYVLNKDNLVYFEGSVNMESDKIINSMHDSLSKLVEKLATSWGITFIQKDISVFTNELLKLLDSGLKVK